MRQMTGIETLLVIAAALYFLPALIGLLRGHHNFMSLLMLNLFLGWTFIGWVGALVWSFVAKPAPVPVVLKQSAPPPVLPKSAEDSRERRPCPMCAEMIFKDAKKCRFCGELFEKSAPDTRAEPRLVARRDRL
jgi:Superinfection immunity protein